MRMATACPSSASTGKNPSESKEGTNHLFYANKPGEEQHTELCSQQHSGSACRMRLCQSKSDHLQRKMGKRMGVSDGEACGSPGICPWEESAWVPTWARGSRQDLIFNSRQCESLFIRTGFTFQAGIPAAVPVKPQVSKSILGFTFLWQMQGVPMGCSYQMPPPPAEQPPSSLAPPRSTRQALTVKLLYLDKVDSLWDTKRDDIRGPSWHQHPEQLLLPLGR